VSISVPASCAYEYSISSLELCGKVDVKAVRGWPRDALVGCPRPMGVGRCGWFACGRGGG